LRLQISNNGWLPMSLPLYSALQQLNANSANVRSFTVVRDRPTPLQLLQLNVDHSALTPTTGVSSLLQMFNSAPVLQYLSCNNCSLEVRTQHTARALLLNQRDGFSITPGVCVCVRCSSVVVPIAAASWT